MMADGLPQVRREQRLTQLEELMLRGFTNREQLAARFSVSRITIQTDIYELQRRWRNVDKTRNREKRRLRIRQLEAILQKSLDAFDKSRQDEVETTTQYKTERCGTCDGKKVVNDEFCSDCDGEGTVAREIVTQRISGSPGDVAYLNAARQAVAEMAKIEGLGVKPKTQVINQGTVVVNEGGSGAENPYATAPAETLQAAMSALHALRQSALSSAVEGQVIEGKVVEENE